jgi:colanic acid biosynthesis glycosyl transferase WcaI
VTPRPHVAFFNRSYYPDTAATGQLLTELCESLVSEHGYRVSVVAGVPLISSAGAGGPLPRGLVSRTVHRGVEIFRARGTRFSKRRFIGRASNYVTYFLAAGYAGLRLDRPDVVVALTDPPIIGLAAYVAARRFDTPFVMSYRDVFPEVARLLEDFQSETVERMLQAVNGFLVRHADRNVALGATMRRRLIDGKGAPPERTIVIPDWTDCDAIVPGPKRNPFSERHGLVDKFVVMHSGNIGLSQALDTLVEAANALRHVPDLEFVFVGEGVKKPALQEQVRRLRLTNVRFLPYQPQDRLTESFATADVFVVSLKAGLSGYIVPSKLYGILAAGRPYVAAVEEDSEVVQIARAHDCGVVAEPGKPQSLAEQILALHDNRARARRMGHNARRTAGDFDRRQHVAAYARVFHDLLQGREAETVSATIAEARAGRISPDRSACGG